MSQNNENSRSARTVVLLTGLAIIFVGVLGIFYPAALGDQANQYKGVFIVTTLIGLATIASLLMWLLLGELLAIGATIFLASITIGFDLHNPTSVLGYVLAISLSGVLIGSRVIFWVSAIALAAFLGTLYFSGTSSYNVVEIVTVVGATAVSTILLWLFSNNLERNALLAEARRQEAATTLAQLQEKVKQEEKVTITVEALAEGLVESSTQQRSVASTAASAITEVSSQVTELAAAANEIAAAAKLIREVGERAKEMAEDARNRLDRDRDQLNQAVRAGEQMQVAAKQVSDNIQQMARIINLITEVAEETHMLSLNATIEATGTGESGRRFRVIAAEVGNLANKVNTSTEQVSAMMQVVHRTTQMMLSTANQTVDSIKRSQVANLATGEQVEQVAEAANDVAREGFLIVSSTEQQRRSTELIANSLDEVSSVARQAAASSEQLSAVASNLRVAVEQLGAALPHDLPPTSNSDANQGGAASKSRPTTRLAHGATSTPNQA